MKSSTGKDRSVMKKLCIILVVIPLFIFFSLSVALSGEALDRILERGYVVVGTSGDQPPLTIRAKDGEMIGLDMDIANLFASNMGVRLKVEMLPFNELLPALESGKIDMIISGMTMTPQRNLRVAFAGPYFVSGKGILTTQAKVERVKDFNELNKPDMTIIALKGSTSQAIVESFISKARLITSPSLESAVQALINGEADALVADFHICAVNAMRYRDKGLAAGGVPFTYEPLGVALPADDLLLVNWVNNFLLNLRGSGDLETLARRWFNDPSWLQQLP